MITYYLYYLPCQVQKESKFLTIPNVLTGLRLLGAPYIGYLVFCQEFNWALGLFMAAAVTDSVGSSILVTEKPHLQIIL